jgi:hypothetical protein
MLDVSGISIPVDGDEPIRGFLAIRRVLADTPEDAERLAAETLKQEDRYRGLMGDAVRKGGNVDNIEIQLESLSEVSWFRWLFAKPSPAFIFYQDEEEDSSSTTTGGD